MFFHHFKLKELFNSCTDYEVTKCVRCGYIDRLLVLVSVLDSFREEFPHAIIITSSFRNPDHNKKIGGSPTSQHMYGEAIDFKCNCVPHATMVQAFETFLNSSTMRSFIGQVIIYDSFIHFALCTPKHPYLEFYDKRNN